MQTKIRVKRELIEAKNKADNLIYSVEKFIKDVGDKAPADMKTKIEDQVKVLRKTLESNNAAEINKEIETLQKLQDQLSQAMYSQAGAGAGAGAGGAGQGAGGYGSMARVRVRVVSKLAEQQELVQVHSRLAAAIMKM